MNTETPKPTVLDETNLDYVLDSFMMVRKRTVQDYLDKGSRSAYGILGEAKRLKLVVSDWLKDQIRILIKSPKIGDTVYTVVISNGTHVPMQIVVTHTPIEKYMDVVYSYSYVNGVCPKTKATYYNLRIGGLFASLEDAQVKATQLNIKALDEAEAHYADLIAESQKRIELIKEKRAKQDYTAIPLLEIEEELEEHREYASSYR